MRTLWSWLGVSTRSRCKSSLASACKTVLPKSYIDIDILSATPVLVSCTPRGVSRPISTLTLSYQEKEGDKGNDKDKLKNSSVPTRPNRHQIVQHRTITTRYTMPVASAAPASAPTTVPPLQPFSTHQPTGPNSPLVHSFFDKSTSTWTYVVVDPTSGHAAIIDSVLEYDCASSTVGMESVKGLLAFVREKGYEIERIMETHVHADHLTGAHVLKQVSEDVGTQDPNRRTVVICTQSERALRVPVVGPQHPNLHREQGPRGPKPFRTGVRFPKQRLRRRFRRPSARRRDFQARGTRGEVVEPARTYTG